MQTGGTWHLYLSSSPSSQNESSQLLPCPDPNSQICPPSLTTQTFTRSLFADLFLQCFSCLHYYRYPSFFLFQPYSLFLLPVLIPDAHYAHYALWLSLVAYCSHSHCSLPLYLRFSGPISLFLIQFSFSNVLHASLWLTSFSLFLIKLKKFSLSQYCRLQNLHKFVFITYSVEHKCTNTLVYLQSLWCTFK